MTSAARSSGRRSASAPPYRPTGVRTPLRITGLLTRVRLAHELELNGRRKRLQLFTAPQELGDRLAPLLAVVAREVVHVHADEAVGERRVEPAPEAERVLHRPLAVRETRLDRCAQDLRQVVQLLRPEVATRDVDAER